MIKYTNQLLQTVEKSLANDEHTLLSEKIFHHMSYFNEIKEEKNFEIIKHTVISKILNELGVTALELHYTFDATVIGQMYEYFHWSFQVEREDSPKKTLKDDINQKIADIQLSNQYYNELPGALRYHNIFKQKNHIFHVFQYLRDNLPDISEQKAYILCAVILFDVENLSRQRQYNFLSYQYISSQPPEKWMSCLMVDAVYKKPVIVIENLAKQKNSYL